MNFWRKWFAAKQVVSPVHALPEGNLVYAVGDIHGRADLLSKLIVKITEDIKTAPEHAKISLVFLGDYIDRGFHSREVIDSLLSLNLPNVEMVFLAGNHEEMLLHFLDDPAEGQLWLGVGGMAALASYGVYLAEDCNADDLLFASQELSRKKPSAHLAFLKGLKDHHQIGDYYFVHAGVRPGVPLEMQRREDKLGIRREFTQSRVDFGRCIVHGHSGVRKPEIHSNRIAVDTGAFATGVLTAVVLGDVETRFLST